MKKARKKDISNIPKSKGSRNPQLQLINSGVSSDELIEFHFKSKKAVADILEAIIARNRKHAGLFYVFYGPFVKRNRNVVRI